MKSAPDLIVDEVRARLGDWSGRPLLLGCSGGVDSMVLAHVLVTLAWPIEIAHVDYGLRPDSGADADLVQDWCAAHDIPFHVLRAGACPESGSRQAWAREVRYRFFADRAQARGLDGVVVAHHADDQAETVALAQARGSGIDGLSGMAPVAPLPAPPSADDTVRSVAQRVPLPLLRPLLGTDRAAIEAAATAWGVSFRTDSSNTDTRFRRAAVRRDMTEHRKHEFLETARISRAQAARWLHDLPESLREALGRGGAHARWIPLMELRSLTKDHRAWYVLRLAASLHASAPRRRSWVAAVSKLMDSPPGARLSVGALQGIRDRDALFVYTAAFVRHMKTTTRKVEVDVPSACGEKVSAIFGVGTYRISRCPGGALPVGAAPVSAGEAAGVDRGLWLDPACVRGRLFLRRWAPGDRFIPLGASGSTKIKKFLVDAAIAPSMKPFVAVLVDDEGIVCVPGHRAAERFRVSDPSKPVLCVEWEPGSAYFPPAP